MVSKKRSFVVLTLVLLSVLFKYSTRISLDDFKKHGTSTLLQNHGAPWNYSTYKLFDKVKLNIHSMLSNTESGTKEDRNSNIGKIAIFGASGNIGSYLTLYLISAGFEVVAYDKEPLLSQPASLKMHSRSIERQELDEYQFVIFLGGCTGRRSCTELNAEVLHRKNVDDVVELVKKMTKSQHFIVASTSAVAEGRQNANETAPIFFRKLDEYSSSMYQR